VRPHPTSGQKKRKIFFVLSLHQVYVVTYVSLTSHRSPLSIRRPLIRPQSTYLQCPGDPSCRRRPARYLLCTYLPMHRYLLVAWRYAKATYSPLSARRVSPTPSALVNTTSSDRPCSDGEEKKKERKPPPCCDRQKCRFFIL
jgi:hypothetical protein